MPRQAHGLYVWINSHQEHIYAKPKTKVWGFTSGKVKPHTRYSFRLFWQMRNVQISVICITDRFNLFLLHWGISSMPHKDPALSSEISCKQMNVFNMIFTWLSISRKHTLTRCLADPDNPEVTLVNSENFEFHMILFPGP